MPANQQMGYNSAFKGLNKHVKVCGPTALNSLPAVIHNILQHYDVI